MSKIDKTFLGPSAKDCLEVANSLIASCNLVVPRVSHIAEINSNLFVLLYNKLTGLSVPNIISCKTKDQEAHNVQSVINALSLNILQLSLSHITGEAVVSGDVVAIHNLLHVLKGILLHSNVSENKQTFPERKNSRLKRRKLHILKETNVKETIPSSPLEIENVFEENAELKLKRTLIKDSHLLKTKSFLMDKNGPQHSTKPLNKLTYPQPCHKSYLLPYTLRKKHARHSPSKNIPSKKHKLLHKEETISKAKRDQQAVRSRKSFIDELLEEFPCIQISHDLMKSIEKIYAQRITRMHKLMKNCLFQKSKARLEAENISKRQLKLADILKKDMLQQQYLKEKKEEKENERKIKYCLRDSRMKSVRLKQYSDEFVKEMKKKMQKRNTAEELIFKKVFEEVMSIQSEQVNDLCQQVRESRTSDDQQYLNYLNSLENLYQTQYLALSEEISNERNDTQLRLNAERQALLETEREFRETLKNEIRFMQEVIVKQTEDCHFREMDARLYIDEKRKQFH